MTDDYVNDVKNLMIEIENVMDNKDLYVGIASLTMVLRETLNLVDDIVLRDNLIEEIIRQLNEQRGFKND
jgi:hypothetical protein